MLTLIVGLILSVVVLSIWCLNLAYTITKVEKSLGRVSSFTCDMFLDRDKKLESLENALNGTLQADCLHYQNVQEQINNVDNRLTDVIFDLNNGLVDLEKEVRKNKDLFQDLIIEQNCNFTKYVDEKIDNIKYYKLSVIERPKKKTRKPSKR